MISHRSNRWMWGMLASVLLATLHVSQGGGGSISKDPAQTTDKPKIQMLQTYAPAFKRDPDKDDNVQAIVPSDDGTCLVGENRVSNSASECIVHPLVVSYLQKDKDVDGFDVWAAVSLDEGQTWKRTNLSHNVQRTNEYKGPCFTAHSEDDGDNEHSSRFLTEDDTLESFDFVGDNAKPAIVARRNQILVAWTSKNCKGGVPGNQGIGDDLHGVDDSDFTNQLVEAEQGEDAQGLNTDKFQVKGRQMCHDYTDEGIGMGKVPFSCVFAARGAVAKNGEIVWTKPERITSGRRDATQLVAQVAGNGAVWALAWQEDPRGLRVGEAAGPGDGMSGATVNHKTDIWYSYLTDDNFFGWSDADENRKNINADAAFTSPVRVTDNAACKREVVDRASDGTVLDYVQKGGPYCNDHCKTYVEDPVYSDKDMLTCVTADGILLNGDTGASRVNMFLLPEDNSVRVILAYEESKGLGKGPGDNHAEEDEVQSPADRVDWGKNIFYHSFLYDEPDEIAHGALVNLPELDENNQVTLTEDGKDFLTYNARRVRMIVQPAKNMGKEKLAMVLLYREGAEGHGSPAHIMMRRFIGGYTADHMECRQRKMHPKTKQSWCVKGSVDLNEDDTPDPEGEGDDARAHRGFLRGDMLVVGYTYTDRWGRGIPKRYDFFVRRSFDGGKRFTNASGQKEKAINLSNVKEPSNQGWSVMEPRLYATPGSTNSTYTSDVQNSAVFYAAYSTTKHPRNKKGGLWSEAQEEEEGDDAKWDGAMEEPMDLYWTMSDNFGESYYKVYNDQSQKWMYPWMAKTTGSEDDTGGFAGAQIRTTPAGTKLFASFQGNRPGNADTILLINSSGPCAGGANFGSAVCSNTALVGDPILNRYDLDKDGDVDGTDEYLLKKFLGQADIYTQESTYNALYDINGDGTVNGLDLKVFRMGMEEYAKRDGRIRFRHLRGGQ